MRRGLIDSDRLLRLGAAAMTGLWRVLLGRDEMGKEWRGRSRIVSGSRTAIVRVKYNEASPGLAAVFRSGVVIAPASHFWMA